MKNDHDIDSLLDSIKKIIKSRIDKTISFEKTKEEYKKLFIRYKKLEHKYISNYSGGFIKGLLYHHNKLNFSILTAVYHSSDDNDFIPFMYTGDKILLSVLPEYIRREYDSLKDNQTAKIRLSEQKSKKFYLVIKKFTLNQERIIITSVTSSSFFKESDFDLISEFLKTLFLKNQINSFTILLNYIIDTPKELTRLINTKEYNNIMADHYILDKLEKSFDHIGIYDLIDLSKHILNTLGKVYHENIDYKIIKICALSLSNYVVIYNKKINKERIVKTDNIHFDFNYHGNNIPFKTRRQEIDTSESIYKFLEGLFTKF